MEPTLQLFGPPRVHAGDEAFEPPPGLISALLLYLACARGWVSRDELVYLLWPDRDERRARNSLRQLLHRIKDVGYAGALEREESRLRWMVETDLERFRVALATGAFQVAVEAYRGPLLDGFRLGRAPEYESWLELERDQLQRAWRGAVLDHAEQLERDGDHTEAAGHLGRLHRVEPLDEHAFRSYVAALARSGRTAEALAAADVLEATLLREVDAAPEEATRVLLEEIRKGGVSEQAAAPVERAKTSVRRGLPTPLTAFVGREREIAELTARLRASGCRILTLVAPGGMGKTRLAAEVADRLAPAFADGVCFVPFEGVSSPRFAVSAMADALSLALLGGRDPLEQVLDHLEGREMLLVLDNLEHLVDDLQLVPDLLARAEGVTLLCTSRERLSLQAEWVYDLQGMGLPTAQAALEDADASMLFMQAAMRARRDLHLTEEPGAIARICRLVGGMPLALELAATWLRVLDVDQIANELERSLDLLASPFRDVPERHHAMRAVFDASWRRLSADEQGSLRKLSVFRGGFTRDAARDVAGASLPLLLVLANKAFVRHESPGRFTQHPLLWQYIRERAATDPAFAQAEERHAAYFAAFMADREEDLHGARPKAVRAEIEHELDNVRQAWLWAIDHDHFDLVARAAESVYVHHNDDGRYHESEALFRAASEAARAGTPEHGRLLLFLGGCHNILTDFSQGIATLTAALPLLESHGLLREVALARLLLFSCRSFTNEPLEDVAPVLSPAPNEFQNAGDPAHQAEAIGILAEYIEDPREAEAAFQESMRLFDASGRCFGILGGLTLALGNYAIYCIQVPGAYAKATELYDRAIVIARSRGEPYSMAWYLNGQAQASIYLGDYDRADQCFAEALEAASGLDAGWGTWTLPHALYGMGWLAHLRGDDEGSHRYLGHALDRIETHGDLFTTEAQIRLVQADLALAAGNAAAAADLCGRALQRYASLTLQHDVREWGIAESLVRLGDIAVSHGDDSGARASYSRALAIARRWSLMPIALKLCVSVAPLARGGDTRARALLDVAAGHPASMFATKEAARRRRSGLPPDESSEDRGPLPAFHEVANGLATFLSGTASIR